MSENLLHRIKRFDAQREGLPGEHWLAAAAGVALWLATRKHPSIAVRVLASVAGTLLVARAASGRDVPAPLRRLPFSDRPHRGGVRDWLG
jgi:uncharacterized membrane protein